MHVDMQAALALLLDEALSHGHEMVPCEITLAGLRKETAHVPNLCAGRFYKCTHDSCKVFILEVCSDGTKESLGPRGKVFSILNHKGAHFGCGITPNAIADPARREQGSPTKH